MNNPADYRAQKISSSIIIDGNVKKEIWQNATWSKRFVDMVTGEPGIFGTQTKMALNSHGIYDTHMPDKWSRIEFIG